MARGIAHREWVIYREDFTDEFGRDIGFRQAIEQEMAQATHIMERLGVAVVSAPVRKRNVHGDWVTEAYVFKTASVPSARQDEPEIPDLTPDGEIVEPVDAEPLSVE